MHDTSARQMVCFQSELRPGYLDSFHALSPDLTNIGETPVHLTVESVHYPMAAPGETIELPDIIVEPYLGDWLLIAFLKRTVIEPRPPWRRAI